MNKPNELPTVEAARATAASLQEKLTHARAWQEQCRQELNAVLLASIEGQADAAAIKKARSAFDAARQGVDDAQGVMAASEGRIEAAIAAKKAADDAAAWAKVRTLAESRTELIEQIETGIAALGPLFNTLSEFNRDILATVPQTIDSTRAELFNAVDMGQEAFWMAGVVAGSPWSQWELAKRPTLTQRITEANQYLSTFSKGA
jgi:hypothetical protein